MTVPLKYLISLCFIKRNPTSIYYLIDIVLLARSIISNNVSSVDEINKIMIRLVVLYAAFLEFPSS